MKYFIDSADIDKIVDTKMRMTGGIAGITVNHTMLKTNDEINKFGMECIERFRLQNWDIFIEVLDKDTYSLISDLNHESKSHREYPPTISGDKTPRFISKIPMNNPANFSRAHLRRFCGTEVYNLIQLNQVYELGGEWSMVYHHKNDDQDFLHSAVETFGDEINLVAASLHTFEEIEDAIAFGYKYATVRPEILRWMFG